MMGIVAMALNVMEKTGAFYQATVTLCVGAEEGQT